MFPHRPHCSLAQSQSRLGGEEEDAGVPLNPSRAPSFPSFPGDSQCRALQESPTGDCGTIGHMHDRLALKGFACMKRYGLGLSNPIPLLLLQLPPHSSSLAGCPLCSKEPMKHAGEGGISRAPKASLLAPYPGAACIWKAQAAPIRMSRRAQVFNEYLFASQKRCLGKGLSFRTPIRPKLSVPYHIQLPYVRKN